MSDWMIMLVGITAVWASAVFLRAMAAKAEQVRAMLEAEEQTGSREGEDDSRGSEAVQYAEVKMAPQTGADGGNGDMAARRGRRAG